MSYQKAFIKLYGAAGAAMDYLMAAKIETMEHTKAMDELKKAIAVIDEMIESGEMDGEGTKSEPSGDPTLTPSFHGEDCLGNGQHEGIECCCDECDHYLTCFPDWKENQD